MNYLGYLPRKEDEPDEEWLFRVLRKKHELEQLFGCSVRATAEEDRIHFYKEE